MIDFWTIDSNEKPIIDSVNFLNFLESNGYYKVIQSNGDYILVHVENNVVSEVKPHIIKNFVRSYLHSIEREDVLEKILRSNYLSRSFLESLDSIEIKLISGSSSEGLLFYQNGFLKITQDSIQLQNYQQLSCHVWSTQIIRRDFTESPSKDSEFAQFVFNLSGRNLERSQSLMSILGYLLHNFKNRHSNKAIIFLDEKMVEGEANGGTGKSLLCQALSKITNVVSIEGKKENNSRFFFQQVNYDTKVLYYDDIGFKFEFQNFFSAITGDMTVEKKSKQQFTIPFALSPKIVMSANHPPVTGKGYSFERRKIEYEISDYYGPDRSPESEFGHLFFDEWTKDEWNRFDNFIVRCIQFYLNNGLIRPQSINLEENILVYRTSVEFLEYADSQIDDNIEYNKSDMYHEFKESLDPEEYFPSKRFTKCLRSWADARDKTIHERQSNGNYLVKFTNNQIAERI